MTVCQELSVEHGFMVPMHLCFDHDPDWSVRSVPLAVNVIQHPLPTPRRLHRLGGALRRAVESFDDERRVVVIATGGMSHQLHGKDFGYVAPEWDNRFLDLLTSDPAQLCELDHLDFMERGGAESVEVIMWLAMRGAMGDRVRVAHRAYAAPMLTGYGVICMEPSGVDLTA